MHEIIVENLNSESCSYETQTHSGRCPAIQGKKSQGENLRVFRVQGADFDGRRQPFCVRRLSLPGLPGPEGADNALDCPSV
jgi:hypothetical protein